LREESIVKMMNEGWMILLVWLMMNATLVPTLRVLVHVDEIKDLRSTWHFNLLLLSTTTSIPKTQQRENTRPSISPDTTAFNNQILFLCVVSSLLLPLFFGVYAVYVRIY
jgi:hypothetical protein